MHRDSLGTAQLIRPGDVNWMVAGRGIVHSERTPAESRRAAGGAAIHGIQTSVALPREHEEIAPSFEHHPAATLPEIRGDGATLRLIAGAAYGRCAPTSVFSPTFYLAATLEPGAADELPDEYAERAAYVAEGEVEVAGELHPAGRMVLFEEGAPASIHARTWARVMLLGGAPLDGTKRLLEILTRITEGRGREGDIDLLESLSSDVKTSSLCGLGQSAPNPVLSTIKYYRDEYEAHIYEKRCPVGVCKDLLSYSILEEFCKGCTACTRVCPAGAIVGEKKKAHKIVQDICIKCGACFETCKFKAIKKG